MKIVKQGNRWVAISSYAEKEICKGAGFRWDPAAKVWYTSNLDTAAKLAVYADGEVRAELAGIATVKAAAVHASRATDAAINVPVPIGLALLPYQKAGIKFIADREHTLLADEMGLGKTVQAIGLINLDVTIKSVLVIAPASLKLNWQRELTRWLTRKLTIGIAASTDFPRTDVVIVNYDIIERNRDAIDARGTWDLLIVDEAHYLKNGKAKRTKAILGGSVKKGERRAIPATRKVLLTGTPLLNRPNELWTILSAIDRDGIGKDFWHFHKRYCAAHQTKWGWDMTGASNLGELQRRLREGVMIRRLKSEVLTELPPKRRQIIELAVNGAAEVVAAERVAYETAQEATAEARARLALAEAAEDKVAYEAAVLDLRRAQGILFEEMAGLRHATALAKAPHVLEHLHAALDESDSKVVVFAWHQDVIAQIAAEFGAMAVTVTGQTPLDKRQIAVDRFQTDPGVRLFVGNIQAAGVGITLTASSHVVFAELDWTPARVTQAEDRTHRIGQKDSVLVQHLVFDGSLDANMARTIVEKQAVIDNALDVGMTPAPEVALPEPQEAVQAVKAETPASMTQEQIEAVHAALRTLAGLDTDRARERNGAGFNRFDGLVGHALAGVDRLSQRQAALGRKVTRKYARQLGADLIAAMG